MPPLDDFAGRASPSAAIDVAARRRFLGGSAS
jgi:hypothetical protein